LNGSVAAERGGLLGNNSGVLLLDAYPLVAMRNAVPNNAARLSKRTRLWRSLRGANSQAAQHLSAHDE
jgi:hypothetical protein